MSLCIKSNPKQHQKFFRTSSLNQLISILQFSPYPTTVNHHLNQVSLKLEFQSEASHYGRTFLQTEEMLESATVFKNSPRKKLLELQNETSLKKLKYEEQLLKGAL